MPTPTPAELEALTDPELEDLRLAVSQERIRRDEVRSLPATIEAMTQRFVNHGGDKTKIRPPQSYERNPNAGNNPG